MQVTCFSMFVLFGDPWAPAKSPRALAFSPQPAHGLRKQPTARPRAPMGGSRGGRPAGLPRSTYTTPKNCDITICVTTTNIDSNDVSKRAFKS